MHQPVSVAVLDMETSRILAAANLPSIRLHAYSDVEACDQLIAKKKKIDAKTIFFVDIVLYGSRDIRDEVGNILSSARSYLQYPCYQEPNTEYDNPHHLQFDHTAKISKLNDDVPLAAIALATERSIFSNGDTTIGEGFQQALTKFTARLTNAEIENFKLSSLGDVTMAVKVIQHDQARRKSMMNLTRMQGFLEAIDQYGKVVEIFVNTSSFLCFIWGPMKFILQV